MHRKLLVASLAFLSLACTPNRESVKQEPLEASVVEKPPVISGRKEKLRPTSGMQQALRQQKAIIDSLFEVELKDTLLTSRRKKFQVWVKHPETGELTQVVNNKWPEEVETTFNFFMDDQGRIIRISEMPYSESGDWDMMFSHYFTAEGTTFAFEKQVSAFNTYCPNDEYPDGITREKAIHLYSPSFTLIDSTYKMTDDEDKDITTRKCELEVDSETQVYRNLSSYLAAAKLKFNK
ncbi:hypothetical protein GU926_12270 [Nibribacter ruber]|uniref:Lipoprotein n=1 Tax=Nibribacter ruber TaxID=2698458 RepID=A0A6P1NWV1_9BACT|nr:hypothetical protein [Nibribacter ruber]QHL88167.1 hypothetical protein GU926_12270 [Nibribacter ruber]